MALVPLAAKGNYFHVYDFRVKPGRGDEFVELFNKFDYGDNNPFHRSRAQVKDGVLCRDAADPDHFYLIGEWADIEEHRRIREFVAREIKPEFVQLIADPEGEGARTFTKVYADSVRAAADAQDQLRQAGYVASPLAGLPVSIKDLFDVAGEVTLAGSKALDDRRPVAA